MNPTKLLPFASPVPPRQQDESAEVGLHAMRAEAKQAIARTCFPALGRVAFLAALVAAGQAKGATFFSEDFSGTSRPTNMTQAGSYATFDGGNARFNGTATNHRTYLRTSDTDYNTTDFVAEVTVTILSTGAQGLVFFGIGQGNPDTGYAYEPRNGPHTFMRPGPDNFDSGSVVITDQGSETNEGQNKAGTGTHRLRLSWDATLSKATFAIDRNYTGGPFVADFTFGPVTGSDNGFTNLTSRIFFGGNAGSTFDDFTVVQPDGGTGFKPGAEIEVAQPATSSLVDGNSKKSFGTVKVGRTGSAKTFTITNSGSSKLTGLAITKTGQQKGDFVVSSPAKTSLPPGSSTTFKVTFKPRAKGTRNAAIHIKSNDPNENPFDIKLTGQGAK